MMTVFCHCSSGQVEHERKHGAGGEHDALHAQRSAAVASAATAVTAVTTQGETSQLRPEWRQSHHGTSTVPGKPTVQHRLTVTQGKVMSKVIHCLRKAYRQA